jgi:hypothetical protein
VLCLRKRRAMRVWWGAVAQLGERLVRNEEVSGSIPLSSTIESGNWYFPFLIACAFTAFSVASLWTCAWCWSIMALLAYSLVYEICNTCRLRLERFVWIVALCLSIARHVARWEHGSSLGRAAELHGRDGYGECEDYGGNAGNTSA